MVPLKPEAISISYEPHFLMSSCPELTTQLTDREWEGVFLQSKAGMILMNLTT